MSEPSSGGTLVWFESDLRLADHPALTAAADGEGPVVPVFVWDGGGEWASGSGSRWWLGRSLTALRQAVRAQGLDLVIRRGDPASELLSLAREVGARRVVWNRRPEPAREERDRHVAADLRSGGLEVQVEACTGLMLDPDAVRTTSGGPYQVFTPFYRQVAGSLANRAPLPVPASLRGAPVRPASLEPDAIAPTGFSIDGLWVPGEEGAHARLDRFVDVAADRYADTRDFPAEEGTSRLSPHLRFGEITPDQIVRRLQAAGTEHAAFIRQLAWREFAYHVLWHFPDTPWRPLRSGFEAFPWRSDPEALERWKHGATGYPLVDAGMLELERTGWMHNRVRMVVASFLTKHLLIPWTEGAAWFMERLVDADVANNTMGWQWAAGCGADAQPFFRIFNPVLQGTRFDPGGRYVRRWLPELESVPDRHVHAPWAAPGGAGRMPIVEHADARDRALDAWQAVRDR